MAAKKKSSNQGSKKKEDTPSKEAEEEDVNSDNSSVYDSDADGPHYYQSDDDSDDNSDGDSDGDSGGDSGGDSVDDDSSDDDDSDDGFEDQGSSDEDEDILESQMKDSDDDDDDHDEEIRMANFESQPRKFASRTKRGKDGLTKKTADATDLEKTDLTTEISEETRKLVHTDNVSSDEDDDGTSNRIGKVPIHWYDEYDHIGYDVHGSKIGKSVSLDRIDQALQMQENREQGKFVVHDVLNDKHVELSQRQLELIRRVQGGAYAHPEHEAYPDYIDYYSGVDKMISGLSSHVDEPKSRFQPSAYDKLKVKKMLAKLEAGKINMDYLTGKIKEMSEANPNYRDPNATYVLWKGDEEDELNNRKGPQHVAAPKVPPPGHASSYIPPDEYLPTEEEIEAWKDMPLKERPHGHLVPKKFSNLRSVGSYQFSVTEAFERCLDLYLCPRVLKRRLNIDPESLVPKLPKSQDLKPFPTAKCMEYVTPCDGDETAPTIRCIAASPNGQFMASGASDGVVRLWEVQTSRLLQSWDVSNLAYEFQPESSAEDAPTKPVVALEWNPAPDRSHHCLLAASGNCIFVIATGTGGREAAEITDALLSTCRTLGGKDGSSHIDATNRASKAVRWMSILPKTKDAVPISASDTNFGPVAVLRVNKEVNSVRWHRKGDYFCSVSPKAGAAAVLIHQLSKCTTQQPFGKSKGEAQLACFHPNKPFLFVASQQHIRVYHLVKQAMVKRLVTGCRWISSLDVHSSGDHLIVGSLDRRVIWFDLDLAATPYKTLKYHERAVRGCKYHGRYPLMASASDDGKVHIFHSMVYSDLMRNPLIVPVKILKGHAVTKNKLGVLCLAFHPTQPWIFTGGADGRIFLYQDI